MPAHSTKPKSFGRKKRKPEMADWLVKAGYELPVSNGRLRRHIKGLEVSVPTKRHSEPRYGSPNNASRFRRQEEKTYHPWQIMEAFRDFVNKECGHPEFSYRRCFNSDCPVRYNCDYNRRLTSIGNGLQETLQQRGYLR